MLIRITFWRALAYKALRVIAAIFALLLLITLYIVFVGISIDASNQRENIAQSFSAMLGREVHFEGPLQFEISARPKLRAGGLHIANAAGFLGADFASLGEVRLALNLWSLLRLHVQVDELAGSDVYVRLQLNSSDRNNWTFTPATTKQKVEKEVASEPEIDSLAIGRVLALLDIKRISLEKLNVEYIGVNERSHFFELSSLVAHIPAGLPISMTLHGKVEKIYPYQLDFTGGTLADLADTEHPWPIDLSLGFMSSRLALNGSVSSQGGEINFGLGTENVSEFERLLQTTLPAVGVAGIAGKVKYSAGKVSLENLNGVMGKTTLHGALAFDYAGNKPKVQGELALPTLDLRPFMTDKPVTQEETPQSLAEVYRDIAKATFSLKALNSMDADLTLRVGQWLSLPGAVRDAMLQVKLERGLLSVPVQAIVADVKLSGSASADARVTPARFKLALGTHDSSVGNLAGLLVGMPDVQGHLRSLDLRIAARGDRGDELMRSLDVRLNIEEGKLSYGNKEGGRPVKFALNKFLLALPAGQPLRGDIQGSLLDKDFSATLHGASLTDIMQELHAPIDFMLQAGSARVQIHAVLQAPTENSGTNINFELSAPHSGEIASWLGVKAGADAAINLHGNFHLDNSGWHLPDFVMQLGRSALSVDIQRTSDQQKPLIKFQLSSDLIDVDQLQSLLPEVNEPEAKDNSATASKPTAGAMIDIPILPNGISLADADIKVRIKHIASSSPFSVRELSFDGHIRDGMMSASPFAANVAETQFYGAIFLDLRSQQPKAELMLTASAMNIGSVLSKLGIARNFDADIDQVSLHLDLNSSHLGQVLTNSELSLKFEGGQFTLRDANTSGQMRIEIDHGELVSAAGAAVRLALTGSLDKVPVSIAIETGKAVNLLNPSLAIPFKFRADVTDTIIQLAGFIDRPFSKKEIELTLDMRGKRFDNLNLLAKTSLPPWGPWSASGKFNLSERGYEVSSLLLQVGSSQLHGHGKLDTKAVPPRIDVTLTAPTIQLDDFRFGDWSPEKAKVEVVESEEQVARPKNTAQAGSQASQLLSREVLLRQNGNLSVRVDQVISGSDVLGNGKLDAQLKNGRVDIGPVVVNTPGGSAMLQLGYEPREQDVAFNFKTEIKNFDYGVLTRRVDSKSAMQGRFSLDIEVNARAQYLAELMRYGNGHVDFAIWPENLKSGVLDFWAVNVLMALLPAVDTSSASKVNCAIGQFVLTDGKLADKKILIDTSRMRVAGNGSVDFTTEEIQLYVQPRAKTPQFLSFAIPIEVTGSFKDFNVGVRTKDVLQVAGQLVTSVVGVPLQMMFGKKIPADGSDVCSDKGFL